MTLVSDERASADVQLDNRWTVSDDKLQTGVVQPTAVGHVHVAQTQLMTVGDRGHVRFRCEADACYLSTP